MYTICFCFQYERERPKLQTNVVPSIFDGAPSYLSSPAPRKRTSPTKRKREAQEHEEQAQCSWINNDNIKTYENLKTTIEHKLRREFPATDLVVRQCEDHVLIYNLSGGEDIQCQPSIKFALRIMSDFSIKMWINGILIHNTQLKWIIGHTNHLSIWTQ